MIVILESTDDMKPIIQAASEGRNVEASLRIEDGVIHAEVVPAPQPFKHGHLEPVGVEVEMANGDVVPVSELSYRPDGTNWGLHR